MSTQKKRNPKTKMRLGVCGGMGAEGEVGWGWRMGGMGCGGTGDGVEGGREFVGFYMQKSHLKCSFLSSLLLSRFKFVCLTHMM